jgi:topoisomerase-4 subunit A
MGGNDAYRETLVVDAEEFIGVKSYKAKGKRLTTFEVATINELEPVRFAPVKEESAEGNDGGEDGENPDETEEIAETTETVETPNQEEEAPKPKTAAKPAKPKKEKPTEVIPNDSVLPDDIIDQGKELDDITGQLSLF